MFANLLLTLAVGFTAIASAVAPFSRYQPNPLPNRVFLSDYCEVLDVQQYFLPNMEGYSSFARSDEYSDLLDNYLYVPYSLHLSWNVNGYQIEDFDCLVFNIGNGPYPDLGMVYGFGTSYLNNTRNFYERCSTPNSSTESQLSHVIANSFNVTQAPWWSGVVHFWTLSNFVGDSVSIVTNEFIDNLEPFFWNQIYLNGIPQSTVDRLSGNGYTEGYNDGKRDGYTQGKQDGIDDAGSATGIFSSLFGGILGVPLDIMNGLSGFVIWNVPVISIIFTFLVVALLLFIIRKFI